MAPSLFRSKDKISKMLALSIKEVQRIAKVSWNATYDGIIPLAVQHNFLDTAYNDEIETTYERSVIYVAEVEGEVVTFANYSPVRDGGKVELSAIYLYPDFQD